MIGSKRGNSIIEYSALIAIICAAIIAMQVYVKRAIQGRAKASSDIIGEQFSGDHSGYTNALIIDSTRKETITPQGETKAELLEPEVIYRSPYVDNFSDKKLTEEKLFE